MPEFADYPAELQGGVELDPSEAAYPPFPPPSPGASTFARSDRTGRAPRRLAGRIMPASREDRVLKALLAEPQAWDRLGIDEHDLLLALPAPHGPLFAWLESQLHEHGPQPWAALREGLRGHPQERHAVAQFAETLEGIDADWGELRGILAQLERQKRDGEIAQLAMRAPGEPAVLERLRSLLAKSRGEKTPPGTA